MFNLRLNFFGFLLNYLLLSTLTATVTTNETASAKAAKVINKKLVSNVTIINFLSLIFYICYPKTGAKVRLFAHTAKGFA